MIKITVGHESVSKPNDKVCGAASIVVLTSVVLFSCALVASHEAFINRHDNRVGRNFDKLPYRTSINEYADSRFLPNGNVEYGFKWGAKCRVYYEVDPETRIIVNWRWEGTVCVVGG